MKITVNRVLEFKAQVSENHTGAYAAQSAYFFMLSMIPIILLLLTIIQYTPVTKADVMTAAVRVFPEENMQDFIVGIVNQVYNQSHTVIPVTAVVALWSAGKGVLAMSNGLNAAYQISETRNYFYLRIRASFYTIIFIIAIVLGLVLSVFGNSISIFINQRFPFLADTTAFILQMRTVVTFVILLGFSLVIYRFLPNRRAGIKKQLPGAVFTSIGWLVISFIFSMYLTIFRGFSGLYGSMTAIILVMLWLYFCMYVMLMGGLLNHIWQEKVEIWEI
ncbi:MAG: YihY/virulence factor BrkB family protein [Coprococcus sp.]|nr:YihY/virulence factor BrkB family protein [Coprococcus sp.]